jgi:CsoR family transcriptional regulator, copper-sensing transcriptional repressor
MATTQDSGDARVIKPSTSYSADKGALLMRLRRMEGQVRGLQQMVAEDRYCLDVVTQVNALTAAAREVALQVLADHLRGCVTDAVREGTGDQAIDEVMTVFRKAMRQ